MAKSIDNNKLDSIKQSAIELIVEKGYGGASISSIAKKANVADGYLYRFYKSKEELVSDLLNSKIEEIANNIEESIRLSNSLHEIINLLVRGIFRIADNSTYSIKFLFVMMNDYSFQIDPKIRERIQKLCREVKDKALTMNELNVQINEEELYMFLVIYPIQYINLIIKNLFDKSQWSDVDIEKVINICTRIISKT